MTMFFFGILKNHTDILSLCTESAGTMRYDSDKPSNPTEELQMSDKKLGPFDADPNLVPFQKEWKDHTGGMANAIFWLDKNWKKEMNAQGNYTDEHGRVIFWNYGWVMKTLLVQVNGSREQWRVDAEKMMHMKDGIEENATIYRPFFRAMAYGMNLYRDGKPDIEWLKTREVVVQKWHHLNRMPLYKLAAYNQLVGILDKHPFYQFPDVKLGSLLVMPPAGRENKYDPMTAEQAVAYSEVLKMANLTSEVAYQFEEHHIHSYHAFRKAIEDFNKAMGEHAGPHSYAYTHLFEEMTRLVDINRPRDAAIVDAMLFERTFEESLEKTTHMAEAKHGKQLQEMT